MSNQDFDPWGKVRPGNTIPQTPLNYTGQQLDGNGLLDYHARLYDPTIARFVSADSVVPGTGPLTLAPSDATAAAVWAAKGGGPRNPQALNRYSYVNNNPLRYTDPTGHCIGPVIVICGAVALKALFDAAVVVVGGYLIYDGVSNLATSTAPEAPDTVDGAPISSSDASSDTIPPVVGANNPPDASVAESGTAYEAKKEGVQKPRSPFPPGKRRDFNTKKAAREAAKQAGNGAEPVHDPYGDHGPHYHRGDGNGKRVDGDHDHYNYPKGRGPKGPS